MQGFILNITKVKSEDLIVKVLTRSKIYTLYRFYGARHSTINLGYKVDFEIEQDLGYLPKMRHITHLGTPWLKSMQTTLLWQKFIKLLHTHLFDIEAIDSFYYDLLCDTSKYLEKQNPKRALIENYLRLLHFEGRLHTEPICFVCETKIEKDPVLVRAFLQAHSECIPKRSFDQKKIEHLFTHCDTQFFEEDEIEALWSLIEEGL
ncbi:recombination protein RecO [Nitratiruptor sp. SB155-2]|uniref:recombination protein RecO n=1 Tax=Nitratiruptor sp. (strain SB155-2) TaxID=387092 RepID=UPI0001587132|nr:recombination protein RecO [Nitratiruptor sp. SB155-2]BAF70311.1 conserved hypothetical protein [Nitratiruptor sp. SB155-2]